MKKKPKSHCSSTISPTTSSSSGELNQMATQKALAKAEKIIKREANEYFKRFGHNASLNELWESNKSRRIDSRLGDDNTRVQQHEKVQKFLKYCSVEDEEGCGVSQWQPKYIEDDISYYLLNALDTATRTTGDLTTALVNAVACYSAKRLLKVIYETFKDSKYRFVEVDETQEVFVDRFTRKGISVNQIFSSTFASHLLEKISSSSF